MLPTFVPRPNLLRGMTRYHLQLANEHLTVYGTVRDRDPPSFVSPEADGRAPW
jgi:hypothetical protein